MCFLGEINLMRTLKEEGDKKFVDEVICDRKCKLWYPYMPGLSPIEHYQDRQMRDFENRHRRTDRALIITGLIPALGQILAAVILSYRESYGDQLLRRFFGQ